MSKTPDDLLYSETHEWVRKEEEGICVVGLTDYAQSMLGNLVFVELPEPDMEVETEEECCVVESVKAASDIYAPVSGRIIEVNTSLEDSPELVNDDPYGAGWIFRIELSEKEELKKLLTAEAYIKKVAEEAH